jgi:hypothetical protein
LWFLSNSKINRPEITVKQAIINIHPYSLHDNDCIFVFSL